MAQVFRTERRVLKTYPFEDEANEIAVEQGWIKNHDVPRDSEKSQAREITWHVADGLSFGYLESYLSKDCCILAIGESLDEADGLIGGIAAELEDIIYSEEELLEGVRDAQNASALARAIVRAGLGAPVEFSREFYSIFESILTSHDDSRVREIALHSMLYLEWPSLDSLIERSMRDDPAERVRSMAFRVRESYRSWFSEGS